MRVDVLDGRAAAGPPHGERRVAADRRPVRLRDPSAAPTAGSGGSLLELSWGGQEPLALPDGTTRRFLEDGDEVVITATAPSPGGTTVGLGEVRGSVLPAR